MKKRIVISTVFTLAFLTFTVYQVEALNTANQAVTPLTGPITGPVTTFEKSISGKLTFRVFEQGKKTVVTNGYGSITAKNINTGKLYTTNTNQQGDYILGVEQGDYLVSATQGTIKFAPSVKFVRVRGNISNIDFQGYIKK